MVFPAALCCAHVAGEQIYCSAMNPQTEQQEIMLVKAEDGYVRIACAQHPDEVCTVHIFKRGPRSRDLLRSNVWVTDYILALQ